MLLNSYRYSSKQFVFGYNPNFPSVMQNKPTALEGATTRKLIASHLNALHYARKRFIKNEADKKLHRMLRHKTRLSTDKVFQDGDQVFYKRSNSGY